MNRELNIHEAKTHLSRYLADKPRLIGLGKGSVQISDTFFDPLPDQLLELFEGSGA